jgi:thiol-disulfide isomerase/thioredoxin
MITAAAASDEAQPRRRGRVVLWAALAAAVVVAALIAVVASAQPSSEVEGDSPLLGNAAPAISGPLLSGGGHFTLAQLRGTWVLVNFMATWCDPCRQEMPQIESFFEQHAKRGDATVLTVAYDSSNVGQLRTYFATEGAKWPAVADPQADVSYGLSGLPSSFLVTPDGLVYAYLVGGVKASELNGWLQQGAAKGYGPA